MERMKVEQERKKAIFTQEAIKEKVLNFVFVCLLCNHLVDAVINHCFLILAMLYNKLVQPVALVGMWPRMILNEAQHKFINFLKSSWDFFFMIYFFLFFSSSAIVSVFYVWPKTILLLPTWHREAKRWDTPVLEDLAIEELKIRSFNR